MKVLLLVLSSMMSVTAFAETHRIEVALHTFPIEVTQTTEHAEYLLLDAFVQKCGSVEQIGEITDLKIQILPSRTSNGRATVSIRGDKTSLMVSYPLIKGSALLTCK